LGSTNLAYGFPRIIEMIRGKHENKGWMRVWIKRPVRPLTEALLSEYTDLFAQFIAATFPTLEAVYQQY
jgi:hypothetical protein